MYSYTVWVCVCRYKRLERNEDTLMRGRDEQEQEEEIIVYERD